ncbi:MAG: hypothetical protein EOP02_06975, partial [Proteobacteria bacterium]
MMRVTTTCWAAVSTSAQTLSSKTPCVLRWKAEHATIGGRGMPTPRPLFLAGQTRWVQNQSWGTRFPDLSRTERRAGMMRVSKALLWGVAALLPVISTVQAQAEQAPAAADWPRYARDLGGTRYSPLDQINADNVEGLKQAWNFRLRPEGGAGLLGGTVPIVIDNVMYLPLGNAVVALKADTGKEIWRHKVEGLVRRGVTYWPGEGSAKPRIFYSIGAQLVALDAANGKLVTAFGEGGKAAIEGSPYSYPPSVYKNVLVIGANTAEMPRGPSGNTRAFDARTGEKLWEFNTVPQPGEVGHESWLDDGWKERSGTNMGVWYT